MLCSIPLILRMVYVRYVMESAQHKINDFLINDWKLFVEKRRSKRETRLGMSLTGLDMRSQ